MLEHHPKGHLSGVMCRVVVCHTIQTQLSPTMQTQTEYSPCDAIDLAIIECCKLFNPQGLFVSLKIQTNHKTVVLLCQIEIRFNETYVGILGLHVL